MSSRLRSSVPPFSVGRVIALTRPPCMVGSLPTGGGSSVRPSYAAAPRDASTTVSRPRDVLHLRRRRFASFVSHSSSATRGGSHELLESVFPFTAALRMYSGTGMPTFETPTREHYDKVEHMRGDHYLRAKALNEQRLKKEYDAIKTPVDRLRKQMLDANHFDVELVVRCGLDPVAEYEYFTRARQKRIKSAYWWLFRVVVISIIWAIVFLFPAYMFD